MKKLFSILLTLVLLTAACAFAAEPLKVCVLTGPTGIGTVSMWSNGEATGDYAFTAAAAPDEIVAYLSGGNADIAAISTNLAAKLYMKTGGGIRVLAVNTLGVLSVLDRSGAAVTSPADLKGRTIYTTGQGANPEYILEYLLRKNGVDPDADVTIEYKADGAELATVWGSAPDAVIVAPAPVSTMILGKYEGAAKVLDLTEIWQECSPDSALMMGCIVARSEVIEQRPEDVARFMEDYAASVEATRTDPARVGELCERYGIVAKAALAQKAIPDCHLCFVTGEEMVRGLSGYLKVLYDADPDSVGALPDAGFWYGA